MKVTKLKKYLKGFKDADEISIIVANPDKEVRTVYPVKGTICISDMGTPCIFVEVDKGKNMDEENMIHTTQEDQMSLMDVVERGGKDE